MIELKMEQMIQSLDNRMTKMEIFIYKKKIINQLHAMEFKITDLGISQQVDSSWIKIFRRSWPVLNFAGVDIDSNFILEWFIELIVKDTLKRMINPLTLFQGKKRLTDYTIKLWDILIDDNNVLSFQFWDVWYTKPYNTHYLELYEIKGIVDDNFNIDENKLLIVLRNKAIDSVERMIRHKWWKTKIIKD